jgi:hypothetical protein
MRLSFADLKMSMRRKIRFPGIAAIDPILRHTGAGCAPRFAVVNADAKTPADWAGVRAGRRR